MEKKTTKRIPNWLRILPKGEYTTADLMKHANKAQNSISRTMINLGIEKYYVPKEGKGNILQTVYIWKGKVKSKT